MADKEIKEMKEKVYNLKYTRTEIEQRIRKLQESKSLEIAMQAQEGYRELEEINQLIGMLEKEDLKEKENE